MRSGAGELGAIERLVELLGAAPEGEVWTGDDAAVLAAVPGAVLFAADLLTEQVHFDRALSSLADVGWKAIATNLSDLAAMGGRPLAALVSLSGAKGEDLEEIYAGVTEASAAYGCPVVGGDLSDGEALVVSVAVLGTTGGRTPVLRSGGRPGDRLFVTGPLGAAAAGLRELRADPSASGALAEAHRRPRPRLAAGQAAAGCGATAMIDLSDGLELDLDRLCRASGVGAALSEVPGARGATHDEALCGGDDYELLIAAPATSGLVAGVEAAGITAPLEIGALVADPSVRSLAGAPLGRRGHLHNL